jgi:hypothetical protein
MADNIGFIHANKLAKYKYTYIDKDGTVYIGQKDGRLAKKRLTASDVDSMISSSQVSTGTTVTPSTGTQDMLNPLLLMGG